MAAIATRLVRKVPPVSLPPSVTTDCVFAADADYAPCHPPSEAAGERRSGSEKEEATEGKEENDRKV